MPKISVLVPIFNVETYLEQCLDSLLGQSFQDIEIICADDGSTDRSGAIIDAYAAKDSRIKAIHKVNTGYGNNMNVALDAATGDYIAILESDDFAEPYMLEKLYLAAQEGDADVVKGEYFRYTQKGDEHSDRLVNFPQEETFSVKEYPHLLDLADTIWSCLYKREFLKKKNIRFHETPGASYQDISFALQNWIHAEKVCCIPEAVLHYRMDNAGSSMNNPDKLYCVFEEYHWAEEKIANVLEKEVSLEQHFVATKYRDYFNHYHRVAANYQYVFLQKMAEEFAADRKEGSVCENVFLPSVWKKLCDMEKDFNAFFKSTAKNMDDLRLNHCRFENENIYINAWLDYIKSYPQVIVYGAGKIGQRLVEKLKDSGVSVSCFAVTALADGQKQCVGLPVKEVSELTEWKDTAAVIIAVAQRNQYEMYQNAVSYGFCHLLRVDEVVKNWL